MACAKVAGTVFGEQYDTTLRIVIYCRISEDREGAGLGVERQLEDGVNLARELSEQRSVRVVIVRAFADNDISASRYGNKPRPDYLAMLRLIESDTINYVLSWHTDRLHRQPSELESYISTCEPRGTLTRTVKTGQLDLESATGILAARIFAATAAYESTRKAENIQRAYRQRVTSGGNGGGIRPFGFLADGVTVDEVEAAEIRKATKMILSGSSLRAVRRDWNARNVLTSKGNQWLPETVKDVLLRPRNAGIQVYRGEEIGPAPWEPIISEPDFRAVVALLTDPSRKTTPGTAPKWLGSGIFRCGAEGCTSRVVCTRSNGSNVPTYRCYSWLSGHPSRRADKVEEYVLAHVFARLLEPDAADLLTVGESEDIPALLAERGQEQAKLDGLAKAFANDQLTLTQLTSATAIIKAKLSALDDRLAAAATVDPVTALIGAKSFEEIADRWEALDFDVKRAVLRELVDVAIVRAPGRAPDGSYFNPASVEIRWKRGN